MAHLLKLPQKNQKGIVLLTHKEARVFNNGVKQIRFDSVNKISNKIFPPDRLAPFYQKKFTELKKHYYVGQHFGWYHRDYVGVPEVDFYLATESTVTFRDGSAVFRVPLSSSSFINEAFGPKNYGHKLWDIITVTHNGKHKRMRDFILSIRKLYDEGKRYRVLLLNKKSIFEPGKIFDNEAVDLYYELFNDEERQSFVMMRLSNDMSFLGMPSETIAQFMNLSKVFALFSEQEGEPRAVAEALICGIPVVTWQHIRAGGSIDHLNETNSVRFETYEASAAALSEAVENAEKFTVDSENLIKRLREDHTIEIFKDYLQRLYERDGQVFDRSLEGGKLLANAVNAHLVGVPWAKDRFGTADIVTKQQFETFFSYIMEKVPGA